jgi:predicted phosphodiesterase
MTKAIRFGVMTDVHSDVVEDAEDRLRQFINEMNREQVDFIIQLGDFCFPIQENKPFLDIWQKFAGPKYHVLGNHDMDRTNKQAALDFLGIPSSFYSFDSGDFHFVVLDGNFLNLDGVYVDYDTKNYLKLPENCNNLSPEQLEWLAEDLAQTSKPTVIFCHQNLESPYNDHNFGVHNSDAFRDVLRSANNTAGFRKVIACMNGHNHMDGVKVIDDIYFIHINSMSYYFMGRQFTPKRAMYKEPLYATVTLENGTLEMKGKSTKFDGPDPLEVGHPNYIGGHVVASKISNRRLKF